MALKSRKQFLWAVGLLVVALLVLAAGHQCLSTYVPSSKIPPEAETNFALMAEAWNTIQRFYVDRSALKSGSLTYGAIGGMVDALGDTGHSVFLSPEMVKEEQKFTEGRYKGIGVEIKSRNGYIVIVAPMDGSPAQKAGLHTGEIILKADGKDLTNLPLIQVVKRISGPEGTRVTLMVLNPHTSETRVVTVTRASITVNNVRWQRLPGTDIAQLRIASFSKDVTGELRTALHEITRHGIKGIILDLRDDPGGLFDEATGCASQFLAKGTILLERNAKGEISHVPVKPGGEATTVPLVVLVNGGTASASEIVTGAIQDAKRAKVVGEKTFGTGTILTSFPLSDGSELLLAVKEWLTPDGHVIWHKGITPDLVVSLPTGVQPLFPEEAAAMSAAQLRDSSDKQLLAALDLLTQARAPVGASPVLKRGKAGAALASLHQCPPSRSFLVGYHNAEGCVMVLQR